MAQTQFHTYQSPVVSATLNRRTLGPTLPGRHAGFDQIVQVSGTQVGFTHTLSGVRPVTNLTNIIENPVAVIVTQQGMVIHESAQIGPLNMVNNTGNTARRIDLLVLTHSYTSNPGGTPGTYSIIQGPLNSYQPPALPSPATQTIIGYIDLGINTITSLFATGDILYFPAQSPKLEVNQYNQLGKRLDFAPNATVNMTWFGGGGGTHRGAAFTRDANDFTLFVGGDTSWTCIQRPMNGKNPDGVDSVHVMVTLNATDELLITQYLGGIAFPTGYVKIFVPKNLWNSGQNLKLAAGDMLELVYSKDEDQWVVVNAIFLFSPSPYAMADTLTHLGHCGFGRITASGINVSSGGQVTTGLTGVNLVDMQVTDDDYIKADVSTNRLKIMESGWYEIETCVTFRSISAETDYLVGAFHRSGASQLYNNVEDFPKTNRAASIANSDVVYNFREIMSLPVNTLIGGSYFIREPNSALSGVTVNGWVKVTKLLS